MPRLLYTYLVNQVLAPFYASLVILTSILFLGKLIPILDIILDYNINFIDFIRLYAYFTPQLLLFALPMASMMGVILGTTHINNENELMVLRASGISLYKMLPPVIIVALSTAVLTGFFSIHLIPAGNRAKAELAFQLASERIERAVHEKRFSESLGDVVLYADNIDPQNQTWEGVYISDMRDPKHPVTIISESGTVSSNMETGILAVSLINGTLHRGNGDTVQTITFNNYDMNLPLETPRTNPLAKVGRSTMLQAELLAEAARLGKNSIGATFLNEYHKRLALPVGCFILTILGFPLGFLSGPRHRTIGISFGLATFILYYVFLTAAKRISETLVLPAAISMWLPNLIFLFLTVFILQKVAQETHTVFLEKFYDTLHGVFSKIPWLKRRIR
ncbi:MAG: LPS export ABC transporter permease LptF [Deltaproteobacteria bacterium]|jgi:lipopolysaccharide export system permease protein|nr:LPS export ABC transporter permease LptF [Deltaproteobacteria bacterium]